LESAFLTVTGQAAHVIPGTESVTVWVAAQTGTLKIEARVTTTPAIVFMGIFSFQ
jgi:hypothetical protein